LEDLSDEFIEETNLFLDYMYACESKVLLNSKPVNGRSNFINYYKKRIIYNFNNYQCSLPGLLNNCRMQCESVIFCNVILCYP
jgi:hypothetical protein